MRFRIGLLVVATGRYTQYLPALLDDLAARFLPQHQRTAFIFSDRAPPAPWQAERASGRAAFEVVHVPTPHEAWPLPTLKRYHYFCGASELLANTDVLFYLDADARVTDLVEDSVLPDGAQTLVGVEHPGFCGHYTHRGSLARALHSLGMPGLAPRWVPRRKRGSFETNPASSAYVADHEGELYFMGGFNGGRTEAFLEMSQQIRENVERDWSRGIVAVWHDESHLNRYFIDHPPKVLSPSYGYPESWQLPYPARIIMLDKDHAAMRAPSEARLP